MSSVRGKFDKVPDAGLKWLLGKILRCSLKDERLECRGALIQTGI